MGGTDQTGDNLAALVRPVPDFSMTTMASYFRRVEEEQKQFDFAIAALNPEMTKTIQSALYEGGYPLQVDTVGHVSLVLNQIGHIQKKDVHYCSVADYAEVLPSIKERMLEQGRSSLYQICIEKDKRSIVDILGKEGFKIIH